MLSHNNVVQIYQLQWDNLPPRIYLEEEIQKAHKRIAVLIVSSFLYNALHHFSTETTPGQEHSQTQSENSNNSEFLPGLCMSFILYSIETSPDQQYSENLNPNGNSMK